MRKSIDPNKSDIPPTERTKRKIVRHLEESGMMEAESINENAVKRVIAKRVTNKKCSFKYGAWG